jgi:formate C-acetyltransferase
MDGCVEAATDMTAGGARYDFTSVAVRGLATTVDSLLALKTLVYDTRELGLAAFIRIVLDEFRGRESLRQRVLGRAPKYGSGDAEADALTLRVVEAVDRRASAHGNIRGGRFRVCYYSYGNHVTDGLMLGATPDGRLRGQPISNGVSPSDAHRKACSPLDAMRTVARLPPSLVSSGVSLNLRFHPGVLATDSGVATFAAMVRTYFGQGGMQLQPNVVSTETLRDAQAHPERYRDLIVKVAGYSAYFVDLGRSIQQDIIARAEHTRI